MLLTTKNTSKKTCSHTKMKYSLFIVPAFVLLCSTASAQLGQGIGTTGSAHNFMDNVGAAENPANGGWNNRAELCRVCHVPHDHGKVDRYSDTGLLWNHALSQATYTMYSSATLDGAVAAQPTGFSKMCLGCHDGTVGIDQFDRNVGSTVWMDDYNAGFVFPGANYANDLSGTHPISIVYDENLDTDLAPKATLMGGSGTIADVLEGGVLQCSSCHDVHDQPGESIPGTHLLRVAQTAAQGGTPSGLCLTCHIK